MSRPSSRIHTQTHRAQRVGELIRHALAEILARGEVLDVALDRHKIELKDAIKSLGTYPVAVRLGKNIVARATVNVVAG